MLGIQTGIGLGIGTLGALLNLDNVLSMTIDGTEYDLSMNIDEHEYYILMK